MKSADLEKIEKSLGIQLPSEYWEVLLARGDELAQKALPGRVKPVSFFKDLLYLTPKKVIQTNLSERAQDSGTGHAFPGWEKTFVLIGDNGGGDYYCLRLDNKSGVFQIGSDCGARPKKLYPSLTAYIDERLKEYGYLLDEKDALQRRTPLPGKSSFAPSCPPADRVALYWHGGPVSGNAWVVYQGNDTNLSVEALTAQGIDLDAAKRSIARVMTVLLRAPSDTITADVCPVEEGTPTLRFECANAPRDHLDRGYWYVELQVACKSAQVIFSSLIGKPPPTEVTFDWPSLKAAVAAALNAASPVKGTIEFGDVGPVSVRKDQLVYKFRYTIVE